MYSSLAQALSVQQEAAMSRLCTSGQRHQAVCECACCVGMCMHGGATLKEGRGKRHS